MKKGFLSKVAEKSGLPPEVRLDIPYITLSGNLAFTLENHRGIISYTEDEIRINSGEVIVEIKGAKLGISHITDEIISVSGKIKCVEFV